MALIDFRRRRGEPGGGEVGDNCEHESGEKGERVENEEEHFCQCGCAMRTAHSSEPTDRGLRNAFYFFHRKAPRACRRAVKRERARVF